MPLRFTIRELMLFTADALNMIYGFWIVPN